MTNVDKIKLVTQCYQSVGAKVKSFSGEVRLFSCFNIYGPHISPAIILKDTIRESTVLQVERYLAKRVGRNFFAAKAPYLEMIESFLQGSPPTLIKTLKKYGWKKSGPFYSINFFTRRTALRLPKGYHISFSALDRGTEKIARKFIHDNFSPSPKMWKTTRDIFQKFRHRIQAVTIRTATGTPCAFGLVVTGHVMAYMYCGCVNKRYRGRGLWRPLIAARQLIAAERGAKAWCYIAENKLLKNKADVNIPITIFERGK